MIINRPLCGLKAVPFLEEPIPDSAMADIGRQGETFVIVQTPRK